jgi:hypothetical protein
MRTHSRRDMGPVDIATLLGLGHALTYKQAGHGVTQIRHGGAVHSARGVCLLCRGDDLHSAEFQQNVIRAVDE